MVVTRTEKFVLLFIVAILAAAGFTEALTGFEFGVTEVQIID